MLNELFTQSQPGSAASVFTSVLAAPGDSAAVGTWVDSFIQWLVSAPIAAQMLFMLVFVVPIVVVAAWCLMAIVDRVGMRIERRILSSRARGSKMDDHVTTQP